MILHEIVHGIAMRICGTKKVKYGFTGLYAFAGSKDFYDIKKISYFEIGYSYVDFLKDLKECNSKTLPFTIDRK